MLFDVRERRDLARAIDELVGANLPEFMMWASPGNWRWHRIYELYPDHQVAALGPSGAVVGSVNAVAMDWNEGDALPGGYDDVLIQAVDHATASTCSTTCLLSISVRPDHRGEGLPEVLLTEMKRRARQFGRHTIVVPLRPTRKAEHPDVPMVTYATWTSSEGEPFDPWIRAHLRLGGRMLGVAERSLVVSQPRARWEKLVDRSMRDPGAYEVPGALAPVVVDERGVGTYAEPNIWIVHDVDP